jgi:hypothetical protein
MCRTAEDIILEQESFKQLNHGLVNHRIKGKKESKKNMGSSFLFLMKLSTSQVIFNRDVAVISIREINV